MPGIFIKVRDESKIPHEILKDTDGGSPHFTLVHTGTILSTEELDKLAAEVLPSWNKVKLTAYNARLNSFFHEGKGKMRHDVLLDIDHKDKIDYLRKKLILERYPKELTDQFNMRDPHITVGTYWTEDEAKKELHRISTLLPRSFTVFGVSSQS